MLNPLLCIIALSGCATTEIATKSQNNGSEEKEQVFLLFQVDEKPKILELPKPFYPYELMHERLSGRTKIELIIDKNGTPKSVRCIEASDPRFSESAIEAVRKGRYEPGVIDGKRVATKLVIPIHFET